MTIQAHKQAYVQYIRVSRQSQGESGLGLEAQANDIENFVERQGGVIVGSFCEVESGKRNDRPKLAEAISMCVTRRAILVVGKLDRLTRQLSFLVPLAEAGVQFVACDAPHAGKLEIHMRVAFAEEERDLISKRTKAALAAAKRRGTVLGTPGNLRNPHVGAAKSASVRRRAAVNRAGHLFLTVKRLEAKGVTTLQGIADALNAGGDLAPRGGIWRPSQVRNLLKNMEKFVAGT